MIRDGLSGADDIPSKQQGQSGARIAVRVNAGHRPDIGQTAGAQQVHDDFSDLFDPFEWIKRTTKARRIAVAERTGQAHP